MGIINGKQEVNRTSQNIYDAFNDFIFSSDIKVLSKLMFKLKFLDLTKEVCGDILELGVFKGSGILSWLKLNKIFHPNSFKKVVGFDMFNSAELIKLLDGYDRDYMSKLFSDRKFEQTEEYIKILNDKIYNAGFDDSKFELIKGDASVTTKQYVQERPGAKISILYMDLDLEKVTYDCLVNLWGNVSKGGYVIFDEYGYHQWSESRGVDKFCQENNIKIYPLDCASPTAYIIK